VIQVTAGAAVGVAPRSVRHCRRNQSPQSTQICIELCGPSRRNRQCLLRARTGSTHHCAASYIASTARRGGRVSSSISNRSQEKAAVQPSRRSSTHSGSRVLASERTCPHIVEIAVPVDGFDLRLSREMSSFHCLHEIRPRFGRPSTRNGQTYCRWCFSEPAFADAFCEQFGGARVNKTQSI
jgi:hypothetical protein